MNTYIREKDNNNNKGHSIRYRYTKIHKILNSGGTTQCRPTHQQTQPLIFLSLLVVRS